jgi:GT2 family glycosyltransferase
VKAAAAVVNWNSGPRLKECLTSIQPVLSEIVVVDNASSDESAAPAGLLGGVRLIRNPDNRGFAAAANQSIAATSMPYVLVLNPDVVATSGAIDLLTRFLDEHERAGAVGGYVNEGYLPRRLAAPLSIVLENLGIFRESRLPSGTRVEQAAAAAMMVRRTAFEQVGGFDEDFFPAWYEDVDFCRRLALAGWEIHFLRQSRFIHEGGYTARFLGSGRFARAYYRNQLRYVRKHFGWPGNLAVRLSMAAGMLGRAIKEPRYAADYAAVVRGALGGW